MPEKKELKLTINIVPLKKNFLEFKVFPINEPIYEYDLRNTSDFAARRIKTERYGSESL